MKDKFIIFAEEPPVELQLSVEMRCREVEKNPDVDYIRRYCISLITVSYTHLTLPTNREV